MDNPKKGRISTKKPLEKSYSRIYLNISSPLAHIYLPDGPKTQVIRDLLINHEISLIGLLLPEWVTTITTSMNGLEQATFVRGHPQNNFTFWISDGVNDQKKNLAVRIQKSSDPKHKNVKPYELLFGESTGLPVRIEYSRNPREFYGMEKIGYAEFRIWRKSKIMQMDGAKKRNIPPEIVRMILKIVSESDSKTDLLPTILICRLVNKSWHHFATTAAYHHLTLFQSQFRTFFENSKSNLYPYLACLDLWSDDPQLGTRAIRSRNSNPLYYQINEHTLS
ncbi:hypothetical protein BC937DRAFT_91615 [Endogone sp. FLAS-F59071]|nr:hypothetical protein BC937DRAFT_91615 [Endogone sp. FLAS-F59071]|eukprot:RUS16098.1 hypothetical protein BC937DRAFT_91615 [Endogone sp. FLAS-F59071]